MLRDFVRHVAMILTVRTDASGADHVSGDGGLGGEPRKHVRGAGFAGVHRMRDPEPQAFVPVAVQVQGRDPATRCGRIRLSQVAQHAIFDSGLFWLMIHRWLPPSASCSSDAVGDVEYTSEFRRRLSARRARDVVRNEGDFEGALGDARTLLGDAATGRSGASRQRRLVSAATGRGGSADAAGGVGADGGVQVMSVVHFASLFFLWCAATLAMIILSCLSPLWRRFCSPKVHGLK